MKKLTFIIGVVLTTLILGCSKEEVKTENVFTEVSEIVVIDSTGIVEDAQNPGTFYNTFDTLIVSVISTQNMDLGTGNVTYSVRHK